MTSIVAFIHRCRLELSGALLLMLSLLVNIFPSGYIILGGDVLQPIQMASNFHEYYFEWFGRNALFYGIFYVLDSFGVSDTAQISWYLGVFLFGAYASFLAFCSLIFPRISSISRVLISLFYATNLYTLFIFTSTWGYTSYQILYIFIPLLVSLFIRMLEGRNVQHLFLFLFVSFIASTSFGNPAFAVSLTIFLFFLFVALLLFRVVRFNGRTFVFSGIAAFGALLLNAFWILPMWPSVGAGIQDVNTSQDIDLSVALQKTSNAVIDTIRLLPTSEQSRYYPKNFPYPKFSWMKEMALLLAFIPFVFACIGFFYCLRKKIDREQKLFLSFFAVFLAFIVLIARIRYPFETINTFLFHLPGINVLRGWDKTAIFSPFLLSALLGFVFVSLEKTRFFRISVIGFFLVLIFTALPFYVGGIQTRLSYILYNQKAKDFHIAKQSALVKIPDDYFELRSELNQYSEEREKISILPYSPGSSVGRVSLPAWKVNGLHVARELYRPMKYIEPNETYIDDWRFAKDFDSTIYNPEWITDLYGCIGIRYVLFQKDAKPRSIEKFEMNRSQLEETGALQLVRDTHMLTLYRIRSESVFPYVYTTSISHIKIPEQIEGLHEALETIRNHLSHVDFQEIGEKSFLIDQKDIVDQSMLVLNEKNTPLWKAEAVLSSGEKIQLRRDESVRYANAWNIENLPNNTAHIEIYFLPQKLFSLGQWISGCALISLLIGIISYAFYNHSSYNFLGKRYG